MALSHGTWQPVDRAGLNQKIDVNSATQQHSIGDRVLCKDMGSTALGLGEFVYLKGVASTAKGDAVVYDISDGTTVRTVAASAGDLAVAMSACVANEFGWYQIKGLGTVTAGTVADNGKVYTTATASTLDDAAVTGQQVIGATFRSADDTGLARIQLNYPFAGAADAIV